MNIPGTRQNILDKNIYLSKSFEYLNINEYL